VQTWNRAHLLQIKKDVTRTMPNDTLFGTAEGQEILRRVLFAYSIRNPSVGYCQGMDSILAHLLKNVGDEEDAFWMLATVIEDYMPGYFSPDMVESQATQLVFKQLVKERLPRVAAHLDDMCMDVTISSCRWFLCLYVGCMPSATVNLIWERFIKGDGGMALMVQVALALLALREEEILAEHNPGKMVPLIEQIAADAADGEALIREVTEGRGEVQPEFMHALREAMRVQVKNEVEATRLWFAEKNGFGAEAVDTKTMIKEMKTQVDEKDQAIQALRQKLHDAGVETSDLKEWVQVSEEEAAVREAQVELLKKEVEALMQDEPKSDEDSAETKARIQELEAQMRTIESQPLSAIGSISELIEPMKWRNEGGVVREIRDSREDSLQDSPQNRKDLLKEVNDLEAKCKVLEEEIGRRTEAFEIQCELVKAADDEAGIWQDATQVSNEFNVKLNKRIMELEVQMKKANKEVGSAKHLMDDLKAKDDQICVLKEMLGTYAGP